MCVGRGWGFAISPLPPAPPQPPKFTESICSEFPPLQSGFTNFEGFWAFPKHSAGKAGKNENLVNLGDWGLKVRNWRRFNMKHWSLEELTTIVKHRSYSKRWRAPPAREAAGGGLPFSPMQPWIGMHAFVREQRTNFCCFALSKD